jgi:hypothetical protein
MQLHVLIHRRDELIGQQCRLCLTVSVCRISGGTEGERDELLRLPDRKILVQNGRSTEQDTRCQATWMSCLKITIGVSELYRVGDPRGVTSRMG